MSDTNKIKTSDTKVQNKDISNEISKEVDAHIWKWITRFAFLGAILGGILGFFGVKEVDRYIRRHIEISIEKSINETVKEEYERTVREQRIFILNWQLGVFKEEADKTGNYNLVLEKIKPSIEKAVKTEDDELIIGYIDTLIFLYFQTRQYKEISSLVKKYEKDFSFAPTSWATVALANLDLYELYGSKEYKKASIKAADNALEQLPGYGSAQAAKLLIYTIDYDKEKSEAEKEEEQKRILRTLEEVNSGSKPVASYETIDYFSRLKGGEFQKYVDKLSEVFPEQMRKMKDRYREMIIMRGGKPKEEYEKTAGREQTIITLNYQLEELKKEVGEIGNYKSVLEKVKPLFEKVEKTKDEALIIKYLDTLISLYFQTGQYEEISSLVKKYEKDFSFTPTGWATVAIANMDLYELYGSKEYKKASIKAADNALEQLPGYGSAQAVKLLIYMIDYDKEKSEAEKEEERKAILGILEEVNSGSKPVSSYETIDYFDRLKGGEFQKYIDKLSEVFPEQMQKMEERHKEYYNIIENILGK